MGPHSIMRRETLAVATIANVGLMSRFGIGIKIDGRR